MSSKKLLDQYVTHPDKTVLVTCFGDTQLLGHAFASIWEVDGSTCQNIFIYTQNSYFQQVSLAG